MSFLHRALYIELYGLEHEQILSSSTLWSERLLFLFQDSPDCCIVYT